MPSAITSGQQILSPATSVLVAEGDSLTTPSQWVEMVALAFPTWLVLNQAVGGETLADMVTEYPTQVAPYFSAARGRNIAILRGGTNDITAGASAATVEGRIDAWVALAVATGFPYRVCTITPVSTANWNGAQQAIWAAVNTYIRATYPNNIIDLAAETHFQTAADALNLTYFSDGTHITAAGNTLLTNNRFIPAMNALPFTGGILGTIASQDALSFGPVKVTGIISLGAAPGGYSSGLLRFLTTAGAYAGAIDYVDGQGTYWVLDPTTENHTFRSPTDGSAILKIDRTVVTSAVAFKIGTNGVGVSSLRHGQATLVGGTKVVSDTTITANTKIFLTLHTLGTVTIPTTLEATARSVGVSFTITSANAIDTSVVDYMLLEP